MASVTGITAEKAQEIADASVSSGHIDSTSGHLILTQAGGTEVDAGSVAAPLTAWPVGSIFMSAVATSPADLLGGGTWVRWGKGKVPVSLDEADPTFDTVEETGGEKEHTLTVAELPSHDHPNTSDYGPAGGPSGSGWSWLGQAGTPTTTGVRGGGQAHNNLQPYIVCYMWKRTA
jgi:hypothetical protein